MLTPAMLHYMIEMYTGALISCDSRQIHAYIMQIFVSVRYAFPIAS